MSGELARRNNLLDVTRGVLILLVVWGHLLEAEGFNGRLYFSIYTFHIPAFAMISGMVSKPLLNTNALLKLGQRLLLPMLVFQCFYMVAFGYVAPDRTYSATTPVWIMWFLFSLFCWKLLLPLAVKLPIAFVLSIMGALIAGCIDWIGYDFSLSRTFVFFPAFLFGHLYGERCIALAARHRLAFCFLFVALFSTAFLASQQVDIRWLWGAQSYSALSSDASGALHRLAVILIGILMSVTCLAFVPTRSKSLAFLGRKTMQVYLLHGFLVMFFWAGGIQEMGIWFLPLTAILAVTIAFALAKIRFSPIRNTAP